MGRTDASHRSLWHRPHVWIVNVGTTSNPWNSQSLSFIDYALEPRQVASAEKLPEYTTEVGYGQQFGTQYAAPIADILTKYTKYNGRRKPELLSPDTYSLFNYREAEKVTNDYKALTNRPRPFINNCPPTTATLFTSWCSTPWRPAPT